MIDSQSLIDGIAGIKFVGDALKLKKEHFSGSDKKDNEKIDTALQALDQTKSLVYELRDELIKLQAEQQNLHAQIEGFEKWQSKIDDYQIIKTSGGAKVYQNLDEPDLYICPSCIHEERIELLQPARNNQSECPKCKSLFQVDPKPQRTVATRSPTRTGRFGH